MIEFAPETTTDAADIEALYDRAFGRDRFEKASYSLRAGVEPLTDLGVVARDREQWEDNTRGRCVGAVRFWPVEVSDLVTGKVSPVLLLGPFAVDPDMQGQSIGAGLMRRALAGVESRGFGCVLLVGDIDYYKRFGFQSVRPKTISLPGGRDKNRLLVRSRSGLLNLPAVGRVSRSLHYDDVARAKAAQSRQAVGALASMGTVDTVEGLVAAE